MTGFFFFCQLRVTQIEGGELHEIEEHLVKVENSIVANLLLINPF